MARCCYADEYGEFFNDRQARRKARHFLRRGLRGSARDLADGVAAGGVAGATILEVGGGVGSIQAHLLRLGAARSTNVELSPNWEVAARQMFAEIGLTERVERRVGNFLDVAADMAAADIVVLHRVICCYPDWHALLTAASAKAERAVAFTVPVDRWWTGTVIGMGNRLLALRGRSFRAYVHSPQRMIRALEESGFRVRADRHSWVWRTIVAERQAV